MAKLFLISGPTCSGKDTIIDMVLAKHSDWNKYMTTTTRGKRSEKDAESYFFVSNQEFIKLIKHDKMFEYAKVHNMYYGATKKNVEKAVNHGLPVVGDVDVQGAEKYRKELKDKVITIFLTTEKFSNLEKRIRKRDRGEQEKEIQLRLENAQKEIVRKDEFDYVVINSEGNQAQAAKEIEKIIENNS